jgi:hypothetical protein
MLKINMAAHFLKNDHTTKYKYHNHILNCTSASVLKEFASNYIDFTDRIPVAVKVSSNGMTIIPSLIKSDD